MTVRSCFSGCHVQFADGVVRLARERGLNWRELGVEERTKLIEEYRASLNEVAPRNTAEHRAMSQIGGRVNLGGVPGGTGKLLEDR
jgi:hypothetical protein